MLCYNTYYIIILIIITYYYTLIIWLLPHRLRLPGANSGSLRSGFTLDTLALRVKHLCTVVILIRFFCKFQKVIPCRKRTFVASKTLFYFPFQLTFNVTYMNPIFRNYIGQLKTKYTFLKLFCRAFHIVLAQRPTAIQ